MATPLPPFRTPQEAGQYYQRLQPGQRLPAARLPVRNLHGHAFRYVVAVAYRDATTGELLYRTVAVNSGDNLTRDEIMSQGEDSRNADRYIGNRIGDAYGDWSVDPTASTITYAARGA